MMAFCKRHWLLILAGFAVVLYFARPGFLSQWLPGGIGPAGGPIASGSGIAAGSDKMA